MFSEERFNRLERIVKLMIRAGLRARRLAREQDEKINMIIGVQMETANRHARNEEQFARNEERFAAHEEKFAQHAERFARHEELFARINRRLALLSAQTDIRFAMLAESQAATDRRLNALIDLYRGQGNGES